ncbi:MAG: MFS transporter [Fimbriiglobus sp.]|jgi:MFS family permease|nr:MFS transporter [Fimbriiglobus sp.]
MTDSSPPPNTTIPVSKSNRAVLLVVFLVVFIDLLGFGIVLPLLPLVSKGYLANASELTKDATIAVLFSVFSLMQFLFSPVWGRISDRHGRRPVLLVSLGGSVVFYALFAVACAVPLDQGWLAIGLMFVSRVGAGIAGASVSTASAVIADSTTPENRAKGMGLIGAAFGIGFTFGPLIAFGVLSLFPDPTPESDPTKIGIDPAYGWVPGAAAAVLSLLALLIAVMKFRETLQPGGDPHRPRMLFSVSRTLEVLKLPSIGPLILIYFLSIFAFANFEGVLARFTNEVFGYGVKQNSLVFAGVGCVLMVAQGGFYRRFAGKVREAVLLRIGLVLMTLGLGGLGAVAFSAHQLTSLEQGHSASQFQWVMYSAAAVAVFGFAFVNPSVAALISRRADPTRQGEVLGVNQSFTAIGRILGPALGNLVFSTHPSHAVPFAAAVGLLLIVAALQPLVGRWADAGPPSPS